MQIRQEQKAVVSMARKKCDCKLCLFLEAALGRTLEKGRSVNEECLGKVGLGEKTVNSAEFKPLSIQAKSPNTLFTYRMALAGVCKCYHVCI